MISENGPELNIVKVKNETCHGTDGEIVASGKNDIGDLTYTLNDTNYGSNSTFVSLKKGSYTIIVKDDKGCTNSAFIDLKYNEAPKITKVLTSPTTCGENNGVIAVEVKSNSEVSYALNRNRYGSQASFNNVPKGEHHIFVKNKDDCLDSALVEIVGSQALKIASIKSIQPSCTDSLGVLEIIESSGEDDLLYSIDGISFQKNNRFQNLKANT